MSKGFKNWSVYQIQSGITGVLAVGTTGESPALSWEEHHQVTQLIASGFKRKMPLHRRHRQQQYRGSP